MHFPQRMQDFRSISTRPSETIVIDFEGQAHAHLPQEMHFFSKCHKRISDRRPSGFWHQRHESGQPFMKMVVRIPGPSWRE
jgi:hypothetical protein